MIPNLDEINSKPNKFGRYMAIKHVERLLRDRNKRIAKLEKVIDSIQLDPITLRLFSEHILEDPPLYELEVSVLLKRLAGALAIALAMPKDERK